jgi:hypothetical protein
VIVNKVGKVYLGTLVIVVMDCDLNYFFERTNFFDPLRIFAKLLDKYRTKEIINDRFSIKSIIGWIFKGKKKVSSRLNP